MRNVLPLLLLASLPTGCAAVAVGAGGFLLADQVLDKNTYVAQIGYDSREVWATAKSTLSHMSLYPIQVDEALKQATMDYDNGKVTVQVETFDLGQSTLRVRATKLGISNGETAAEVQRRILRELERQHAAR